ncbi:basic amino acid ABC transporter substrate-binding protein [Brevibacillus humidisoli]|uniref:basic amino acid ABC transporter substrate-binding protein n=1 Tax=Brevibacillus humidisoli TaxID=2895522 RepID=UPI001E51950B|nr:basic amino acid ABC transporter substrate-binding protein [Brevibacillus humidisoli]UFJ40033.1 basic amino acid ABC transporter substrate-binding protein [Brevibacillus humidisoli]
MKKNGWNRNWLLMIVALLSFTLLAAGCGTSQPEAGNQQNTGAGNEQANTGDTNNQSGEGTAEKTYVVGTDAIYPPFEKMEADKISGFDIDVINAIAEAAGMKIEIKHTGWDPLFDGIEKGTVDLGISAITITDDRKQKYDFTEPYFEANQLIMVAEDSPVTKLADLKGMTIGVQGGTTGAIAVKKAFGDTYEGLREYEDTPSAVDDFFNGRVQAVVADNGVLSLYTKTAAGKKFKLLKDDSFEKEYYGIMVKKGNSELLEKLNQGLKTIQDNGKLEEIHKQYFVQ